MACGFHSVGRKIGAMPCGSRASGAAKLLKRDRDEMPAWRFEMSAPCGLCAARFLGVGLVGLLMSRLGLLANAPEDRFQDGVTAQPVALVE